MAGKGLIAAWEVDFDGGAVGLDTDMSELDLEADVLVIGGGMAAIWAAISAAQGDALVVLVDKGFVGSSGVTGRGGRRGIVRHGVLYDLQAVAGLVLHPHASLSGRASL